MCYSASNWFAFVYKITADKRWGDAIGKLDLNTVTSVTVAGVASAPQLCCGTLDRTLMMTSTMKRRILFLLHVATATCESFDRLRTGSARSPLPIVPGCLATTPPSSRRSDPMGGRSKGSYCASTTHWKARPQCHRSRGGIGTATLLRHT